MTLITLGSFVGVEAASNSAISPQATGGMLVARCLSGWFYALIQMLFAQAGKHSYAGMLNTLRDEAQQLKNVLAHRDTTITTLNNDIATLQRTVEEQSKELFDIRLTLATQKVTRKSDVHNAKMQSDISTEESDIALVESDTAQKKVTTAAAHAKRQQLKEHFQKVIARGEKVNFRKMSLETGISYGMVRKYAESIMGEITNEHPAAPRIALVR
jgi:ATP-dependent Clp protease ATP-binding subunit ClpA